MKRTKSLSVLLIVGMLTAQLTGLVSCEKQPVGTSLSTYNTPPDINLPSPIQERHRNCFFSITWFQRPFSGYFTYITLNTDNTISYQTISQLGSQGGRHSIQLSEEAREEIRAILEVLAEMSPSSQPAGLETISASFLWYGENHLLSFDESSCPEELHRLIEITDEVHPSITVQNPCQTQNPTLLEGTSIPIAELPDSVREAHNTNLLIATWYTQPFSNSYDFLTLVTNYCRGTYSGEDVSYLGDGRKMYSRLTESESQEVQSILESLIDQAVEQPEGDRIITTSFLWAANYYQISFGNLNCPDNLQQLFEIIGGAHERDYPGFDFQNPCRYGSEFQN